MNIQKLFRNVNLQEGVQLSKQDHKDLFKKYSDTKTIEKYPSEIGDIYLFSFFLSEEYPKESHVIEVGTFTYGTDEDEFPTIEAFEKHPLSNEFLVIVFKDGAKRLYYITEREKEEERRGINESLYYTKENYLRNSQEEIIATQLVLWKNDGETQTYQLVSLEDPFISEAYYRKK